VFDGAFDAEQVARVVLPTVVDGGTPDVLDRLISLAERSLISRDLSPLGDDARLEASGIRFGMLKTVQSFAAARLVADGREADVRERHAQAYVELAEAAARHLNTGRQPPWLDRLARDDANLRAALRWSIATGDVERAQRLIAALWRYWLLAGRLAEGAEWVAEVFALPGSDRPTRALVGALTAAGGVAYWRAEREASLRWYEEELAVARLVDDAPGIADAYFNLSAASFVDGDITRALECAREAHRRFADLGDEIGTNRVEWGLTNLAIVTHGPLTATSELKRLLDRAEELNDAPYAAIAAGSLAWTAYMLGDVASAGKWTIRAMLATYALRDVASSTIGLPIGAVMALEAGRPRDAAIIMGAFEALTERYGVRPPLAVATLINSADPLERARADLEPEAFAEALESGRRMTLGETIDLITRTSEAWPAP
jgi:tetratricopeptide (TPR) repeat protein